jgi:hypothetical protein
LSGVWRGKPKSITSSSLANRLLGENAQNVAKGFGEPGEELKGEMIVPAGGEHGKVGDGVVFVACHDHDERSIEEGKEGADGGWSLVGAKSTETG